MTEPPSLRTVPQASTETAPVAHRFRREMGYLLSGLPLGVAAFTVAVTGFTLGVSTLAVWIGLPILAGTLRAVRALANTERRRVTAVTAMACMAAPQDECERWQPTSRGRRLETVPYSAPAGP